MKNFRITYWLVIALGLMLAIPFVYTLAHPKPTAIEVGIKALNEDSKLNNLIKDYYKTERKCFDVFFTNRTFTGQGEDALLSNCAMTIMLIKYKEKT